MIEEGLGIGAALRAARERKGWTTQDAGSRLRLMARQIEAIEQEDFARLGQPVFARGFVRNYAKLLGLNPDELLEQMTRVKTETLQETENLPFTPGDEFWKSPWVLGGIAAVILLLAIPVSLYLWLNSEEEAPVAAAVEQAMPPLPPPAPVTESVPVAEPLPQAPPAAPASAAPVAPLPAMAPAAVPQPAAPAPVQSVAPAAAAANSPSAQPAAAKPPQAPTPPAAQPAVVRPPLPFPVQVPPAPVNPPVQPSSQPVSLPPPPAPPKPSAPVVQAPAPSTLSNVRMQFDQPAWVQVRDSTGRTLHSGLNPAGGSVEVSGKPPYYLVVGNAANVRVTYKGKPVDLKPYIDVTVARLTLNP